MKNSPRNQLRASLSKNERKKLLVDWNATKVDYPRNICLHHLFEAQVKKTPNAVAVVFEDQQLTYRELNQRSNQLARHLKSLGVKTESFVAICMERSLEMVVAIYGTMKAGAAYVPIDPTYPQERLGFMLQDANAPVLLTQDKLRAELPPLQAKVVCVDSEWPTISREKTTALRSAVTAKNLAYMIYTSGSTGKPKGAMNTHRGICNRLLWMQDAYHLKSDDRVMQKTPFSFDVSVWEFFWPLLAGARLVVARPEGHRDSAYLVEFVNAHQITTMHFVPSMLQAFLRQPGVETCRSLRRVICSGEALPYELQQNFFKLLPFAELHNLYGPTEAAVDVTHWKCQPNGERQIVPIGKPIANTQLYILNPQLQPVPIGEAGELHIGGVGLARGYHNRPELTAEKFIRNPFSTNRRARLYKTGDLARYLPDGNIEYLGRLDHQVKIRGFRIELGEIEAVLSQHPAVQETIVVAREDTPGDKRIVAYLVSKTETPPTISDLHAHLKQKLPDYMVPSAFVILKEMPLSPNGKIDRKALPAPDQSRPQLKDGYVAPQTDPERILAEIWAEVLGIQPIGIHDNFFELGGDSIRVIQIIARAQQQGLAITLEQLFEQQTIHRLARQLTLEQTLAEPTEHTAPFELVSPEDRQQLPADVEDAYPMLKLQIGMVYHNELNPASAVFHDVFSFRLRAPFDREKMERVLQQIGIRHANFRTSFNTASFTEPLQLVHKSVNVPLSVEDLRPLPAEGRSQVVMNWIEEEKQRPFDLSCPPLLRFHVQQHSDDEFQFFVSFSHLTLDGWSLAALVTEIFQDYAAALRNKVETPATMSVSNGDYVALETEAMMSEERRKFWRDKLNGAELQVLPRWPKSYRAGGVNQRRGPEIQIPAEVFEGLKKCAHEAGVPLKSVLQAAHYRVMSFLHGSTDVISGMVTNGRPEEVDAARLLGLFLNIVPVRIQMNGGSWIQLAQQTFAAERELIPYRRFPLAEIQRINGNQSFFETDFDFVHWHSYRDLQNDEGLQFAEGEYFEANNFVLSTTFVLNIDSTRLEMHFDYDPNELAPAQIEAMCGYYVNALKAMAEQPHARYEEFSPLSEAERRQLLVEWNQTEQNFPAGECLHQLFEAQVERTPEDVAVVFEEQYLTYRQLNDRANQLAYKLHEFGVGPDALVGLCLERSLELVVGLLGILKAGGAYVPIDPTYPPDRVAFMLEDANASVVLMKGKSLASLSPSDQWATISLDREKGAGRNVANPNFPVSDANLAYLLYTSGSTGKPKGAMIPHRAIVNHMRWMQSVFPLNERDSVLQKTPISFDASVWEFYAPLFVGGRLVVARPEGHRDAAYLVETINSHHITTLQLVPSLLRVLLETPEFKTCRSLRRVFCGGETLTSDVVHAFCTTLDAELHNLYGPTEVTIDSVVYSIKRDELPEIIPIGRPVANTQAYILDNQQGPVAIAVPGELYLGGVQVGRGYHNRPELTAERFLPDPFRGDSEARLYRTGDKVRYLPDGNIEFLGRVDQQVKIRGYRIELGEIESVLRGHPQVKDGVVVVRDGAPGGNFLMAYVISHGPPVPTVQEIRNYLKQTLPEYMVPSRVMILNALPLTPNGKIDRRALPEPAPVQMEVSNEFVGARDAMEQALANIWAGVLKVDGVGIQDNFFELGGNSLLAVRLFSQIKKLTGKELPLVTLFEAPTIEKLAAILRQEGWESPWASLVPIKPGGSKPPFYCVHGVGGNILEYLDLAKYMDVDQPFYGLQAIGLDGKRPIENLTVEQMATRYIEEIRGFQPRGPYYIGGSSFGGLVAYEMAQQLTAAGEEVGLLAFFDTNGPGYPKLLPTTTAWKRRADWWLDRVALHWGNLRASRGRDKLRYVGDKTRRWNKQFRWKRQRLWDQIRERVGQAFWPEGIKQVRVIGYRAATTYKPQPYAGRATLFRATEQPRGIYPDPTLGWDGLVQGGLKIHDTPGHHGAIVREPRSRVLAEQLQDALTEAQAKHSAAHALGKGLGAPTPETPAMSMAIALTATFTAEPIEESLAFWMKELGVNATIQFAPYNQIFQQLLDPGSLVAKNQHGINVYLIRVEDWWRNAAGAKKTEIVERNIRDLAEALRQNASRSSSAHIVCLCPDSPAARSDRNYSAFSNRMEQILVAALVETSGVYAVTSEELLAAYPVGDHYDAGSDKLGHVPYTPQYFTALGTVLARKMHALKTARRKVIVLDCDQTLWGGVCGEDGPAGVTIDSPRRALQEFMLAQHDAGMLLCLCTKNNEQDVWDVFQSRPEMILQRDHLVAWRINWHSKSENLKSLAAELKLGLDSFIFIDDNPIECAEVEADCPEVLTIQLPTASNEIPQFLRHVWAFDHLRLTAEDQKRTALYQENAWRERFSHEAPSFAAFLAGLELEIHMAPMQPEQLARVAQLTQRTNQFNCTTIRRTENEIEELKRHNGAEILTVEVKDRFGEYGLVGVLIFWTEANRLVVDTFLLSCRALGKGVEQRMFAHLGEDAAARGCDWVDFRLIRTAKNSPAFDFISGIAGDRLQVDGSEYSCRLPAGHVASISLQPRAAADAQPTRSPVAEPTTTLPPSHPSLFLSGMRMRWIASEMNDAQRVYRTITAYHKAKRSQKKPNRETDGPAATARAFELEKVRSVLLQHPGLSAAAVISQSAPGAQHLVAYIVSRNGPPDTQELHQFLLHQLPEQLIPSSFLVCEHLPLGPDGNVDVAALPQITASEGKAMGERRTR